MQNGKTQKATPNGPKRDGGAYTRGIHHTATKQEPSPVGWMEWIAYKGLNKWQEKWMRKRKRKGPEKKVTIFALHELQSIHPSLSSSHLLLLLSSSPLSLSPSLCCAATLPCFDLAGFIRLAQLFLGFLGSKKRPCVQGVS